MSKREREREREFNNEYIISICTIERKAILSSIMREGLLFYERRYGGTPVSDVMYVSYV